MAVGELPVKYNVVKFNVAGGTQVSSRVTGIVKNLSEKSKDGKPTILVLSTSSRYASKLITVLEIAKRELCAKSVEVYQYNALGSKTVQVERKAKQLRDTGTSTIAGAELEENSDDAFETMGQKDEEGTKQRTVPTMTTYLSNVSVKELKKEYGEQR